MGFTMTENQALQHAIMVANASDCAKSKRGVVIFHAGDAVQHGPARSATNGPPHPFTCDGSPACRAGCRDIAIHAEARAIIQALEAGVNLRDGWELLHVKVIDGAPVPSGPPSCVRCSALILESGIARVWLLHAEGLVGYSAVEFHRMSLEHHGLQTTRVGTVATPKGREICTDINIAIGEIRAKPWAKVMGATPPGGYELRDRALFRAERGQPLTDAEREMLLTIANGLRAL